MLPSLAALAHPQWPVDPIGVHLHEVVAAAATIQRVMQAPPTAWGWWMDVIDAIHVLGELPPDELAKYHVLLLSLMGPTNPDIAVQALNAFVTLPPLVLAVSIEDMRELVRVWSARETAAYNTNEFISGVLIALARVVKAIYKTGDGPVLHINSEPFVTFALAQLGNPILHTGFTPSELVTHRDHIDAYVYDVLRHLPLDERIYVITQYAATNRSQISKDGVKNVLHNIKLEGVTAWRGVVQEIHRLAEGDLAEVSEWALEVQRFIIAENMNKPDRAASPTGKGRHNR